MKNTTHAVRIAKVPGKPARWYAFDAATTIVVPASDATTRKYAIKQAIADGYEVVGFGTTTDGLTLD